MVHEIATLVIDPKTAPEFEAAVAKAEPFFRADEGCHGFALRRVIETPDTYHLVVEWSSVEAHEAFRLTDNFTQWRGLAGPFFTAPPSVVHTDGVIGAISVA